ncbi:PREDICTED: uncharacterized protein LOC104611384 [Nelumbo nucifera]|uniref:Transmembrane protein n=2 Tax=Nelumbo nucifera TaxID=4432 RepID=A0A822ZQU2_NELNU|nr:PREDICTED: uncharacterized protein LOC104611384 [Nelumbo nucifera]DAD45871.1 TPA_asm: hypothetical protein HUJ06_004101 [Nelumbo nucifera]
MAIASTVLSSTPLISFSRPNLGSSLRACGSSLPLTLPTLLHSKRTYLYRHPPHKPSQKNTRIWRTSATSGDVLPSDAPIETAQQIVSSDDSGVSTVISALLFIAFIGLSILTIGIIYISVSDFLQKREREKFEKEEASKKKKKSGKRVQVRAKTGPRGFGQKIDEDDDFD